MDDPQPKRKRGIDPCPVCAYSDFTWGVTFAVGASQTLFRPDDANPLEKMTGAANVPLRARLCNNCGNVLYFAQ